MKPVDPLNSDIPQVPYAAGNQELLPFRQALLIWSLKDAIINSVKSRLLYKSSINKMNMRCKTHGNHWSPLYTLGHSISQWGKHDRRQTTGRLTKYDSHFYSKHPYFASSLGKYWNYWVILIITTCTIPTTCTTNAKSLMKYKMQTSFGE
jgi:hypothetical protein